MDIFQVSHEVTKPIQYTKYFNEFNKEVLQIKMKEGAVIGEHATEKFAFVIVQKGTVDFKVNDQFYKLTDEQILYLEPMEKHALTAITDCTLIVVKC